MHNKLVEILEELNIPIGFQKFEGEAEEYIIFNISCHFLLSSINRRATHEMTLKCSTKRTRIVITIF